MSGALHTLAERLAATDAAAVPLVRARTQDAVGAFVLAAATDEAALVRQLGSLLGGPTVWSTGVLDTVAERVAITRLSELDDIHMGSCTTVGSIVIPTAITLGAALGSSPAEYADAVVSGYDAMVRLGVAIDGARVVYGGTWPTYLAAAFGAAAVTARLLALDAAQTSEALGGALARSSGAGGGHDSMLPSRWVLVGDAARAGCLAAFAASLGYETRFDVDRLRAASADGALLAAPRSLSGIAAVSVKPFVCAKQSVAAAEAALALADCVSLEEIDRIRVLVAEPYAGMIAGMPGTPRLSRIASAPWNVALALGRPEQLDDIARSVHGDPRLVALAERVVVRADDELTRHYPEHWPARVEIDVAGRTEVMTVVDSSGDPGPDVDAMLSAKWKRLLASEATRWQSLAAAAVNDTGGLGALDRALAER